MAQGWDVNASADTITFYEAPANGAVIEVNEYGQASYNATDVWAFGAWSDEFGYPSEVEFFSDRLIFASTETDQQSLWMSQTGDYTNFGKSTPIVDSDAISVAINSRKINKITDLVGLDSLLILTAGTEWRLDTGSAAVIPTTVGFKPQSYNGSGAVPAVVVDKTALYIQKRGQSVRELSADDSYTGQYGGRDVTAFANHLLEGHTIIEWAYQQYPYSIIWAVRDDGILLCLTYMKERDVIGWTRCKTDGLVESVCVIPEGEEDAVYVVVQREAPNLEPSTHRMIERLSSRQISDIRYATFLDSFLVFDGTTTDLSQLFFSPSVTEIGQTITVTSSIPEFSATDPGDYIVAAPGTDSEIRFLITEYLSSTSVTAVAESPVQQSYAGAAAGWAFARREIEAPAHLIGNVVGIFGDGSVYEDQVVSGDPLTIDPPAVVVCVGLKYESDLESLEINAPGAETLNTKNKLIKELGIILQESRSVRIGPDFDHLDEMDARQTTEYGTPDMLDGVYSMPIRSSWAERGRFCIRQSDPLPIGILGVIPEFKEGK